MRLWTLHPKYLDTKGLLALWRESLLAKHVLEGKTKGYKNHPQLERFKSLKNPGHAINHYLTVIYFEATRRSYNFTKEKINWQFTPEVINVTSGQLKYESKHLLKKLRTRDLMKFRELHQQQTLECHPIFQVIEGPVEKWEIR